MGPTVLRPGGALAARTAVWLAMAFAACAAHPRSSPPPQTAITHVPEIRCDDAAAECETQIRVLTYNVAGIPWPVRKGPLASLDRIGHELAAMRARGEGPDVLLLQEAFIGEAGRIVELAGYRNFVRGPKRADPAPATAPGLEAEKALRAKQILRGEGVGKWLNSGLYVASDYPILERHAAAFRACAGFDCLSNKGIVLVRLAVPGVPTPLEVFTTHMNSRKKAGVPDPRSTLAHGFQVDEIDVFLSEHRDPRRPLVFGGDFNTGGAPYRFDYASSRWLSHLADEYCTIEADDCEIRLSYDGDEPWLDTQDLQGFLDGSEVRVRPIRIEAMFDEPIDGTLLSDHDGLFVEYRLRWSAGAPPVGDSGRSAREPRISAGRSSR